MDSLMLSARIDTEYFDLSIVGAESSSGLQHAEEYLNVKTVWIKTV
jgi:hypothetical protein